MKKMNIEFPPYFWSHEEQRGDATGILPPVKGYIEDVETTLSYLISPRLGYSKLGAASVFSLHGNG